MYATMTRSNSARKPSRTLPAYAPGERLYIAVPKGEGRAAYAAGARLDTAKGSWWIPAHADKTPFTKWILDDVALSAAGFDRDDIVEDFRDAMQSYGLKRVDPIADGQWHCSPLETDTGDKAHQTHGGYLLSLDGTPKGYIRNFKGQSGPWRYQGGKLTPAQKAAMQAQQREKEAAQRIETERQQKAVADKILAVLVPLAQGAGRSHGYLARKGVAAHGLRVANALTDDMSGLLNMVDEDGRPKLKPSKHTWLVIPGRDVHDNLLTVQAIDEDGNKLFASGARKKGALHVIGVRRVRHLVTAPAVLFCEGYATGASLHEATGLPVVICFDAGNVAEVARQIAPLLRADQPKIVCADNDQFFLDRALARIRALGTLATRTTEPVRVRAGVNDTVREVALAGVVADGQWHEVGASKYRLSFDVERGIVCGVALDIVATPGDRMIPLRARNAGVDAAIEGARILNGSAIAPAFASLDSEPTDFNDLGSKEGQGRIVDIVQAAIPFSLDAETV
jgi:putative DNA primase/helicase